MQDLRRQLLGRIGGLGRADSRCSGLGRRLGMGQALQPGGEKQRGHQAGRAQAALLNRSLGFDAQSIVEKAAAGPGDVPAQLDAASAVPLLEELLEELPLLLPEELLLLF